LSFSTLCLYISADLGGNLGLFLGCSILTVFEFIDFLIVYCTGMYRVRRQGSKRERDMDIESGQSNGITGITLAYLEDEKKA